MKICGLCGDPQADDWYDIHMKACRRYHAHVASQRSPDVQAPDEDPPPREPPKKIKSGGPPHKKPPTKPKARKKR